MTTGTMLPVTLTSSTRWPFRSASMTFVACCNPESNPGPRLVKSRVILGSEVILSGIDDAIVRDWPSLASQLVEPVQRGDAVAFAQRRIVEDGLHEVLDRSLKCHHRLPDVDELGGARAD